MSSYSNITDSNITDIRTQPDFKIVAPSGLISGFVNALFLIYLLVRLSMRWWVTKRSLPMAHRVPFYIAMSEFILFWINLVNVGYTSLNGHSIQGDACKIVGGMVAFIVTSNLALVGLISLTTYLRVCKKITLEMGRYDYRFFLIICLISILISLVGINDYGPSRFWCYNSPSNPITPLITISLIFLILFITSFCYIMTLLEVNIQQSSIKKLGSNNSHFSRIDLLVVRKIIAYILIFLIEWTPTTIYLITSIFQYENIWIYTASVIFINLGGIGNAILYISYEGWTNRYGESKNCSTNASSGYSETNQESYPQIKIHDVEKENLTSRSSTLNLPDQEL